MENKTEKTKRNQKGQFQKKEEPKTVIQEAVETAEKIGENIRGMANSIGLEEVKKEEEKPESKQTKIEVPEEKKEPKISPEVFNNLDRAQQIAIEIEEEMQKLQAEKIATGAKRIKASPRLKELRKEKKSILAASINPDPEPKLEELPYKEAAKTIVAGVDMVQMRYFASRYGIQSGFNADERKLLVPSVQSVLEKYELKVTPELQLIIGLGMVFYNKVEQGKDHVRKQRAKAREEAKNQIEQEEFGSNPVKQKTGSKLLSGLFSIFTFFI